MCLMHSCRFCLCGLDKQKIRLYTNTKVPLNIQYYYVDGLTVAGFALLCVMDLQLDFNVSPLLHENPCVTVSNVSVFQSITVVMQKQKLGFPF